MDVFPRITFFAFICFFLSIGFGFASLNPLICVLPESVFVCVSGAIGLSIFGSISILDFALSK